MDALFFYMFSAVLIASAFGVIAARNPVNSVLWLILAFCNGAGLFLLQGAEFLAMMLDVDFAELRQGFQKYLPAGAAVGVVVLLELGFVALHWHSAPGAREAAASPVLAEVTNTAALGRVLYTKYVIFFQAAGLVLLTAMIGAISLTLHHRPHVKRQNISEQNARTAKSVVELKKVRSRVGVEG